jgi:tRNA(fMet)-specific endonuclease VapC
MTSFLLDTNHASPLVTIGHPLRQRILKGLEDGHSFALCVPSLAETLYGISILPRAQENRAEWSRLRPFLPCYVPDEHDAEHAADLRVALRKQGRQLETVDSLIAVITLRNDLTLLTTDGDFTDIPQLKRENWLAR